MSGVVVWFTGLPSSGKSTLARHVAEVLRPRHACVVLDSDDVRAALVPKPGYDDAARDAFYDTLARLAAVIASQGLVVLVPATAHLRRFRERARTLAPAFLEVFVATPAAVCAERDDKGLYAASRAGRVDTLPGRGVAYEQPETPDVMAEGGEDRAAIDAILAAVISRSARGTPAR